MNTQFKAGDRALFSGEIPGTGHRYHSPVEVQIKGVHGNYVEAVFPDRRTSWSVWINQLTPISTPHKFKVGDRVRIIGNRTSHPDPNVTGIGHNSAQFNGKTGCIMDKARPGFGDWLIVLEGDRHYSFFADELELLSGEAFKVGDRVEGLNSWKNFSSGYVIKDGRPGSSYIHVRWDGFDGYQSDRDNHTVPEDDLRLLSPQSPQPQTQKPKEDDMKRYAVIYKNMASNEAPNINSTHATEAEAKLAGEQLVAGQRQDLVKKNFFSVSILDTHTGTLIGSVVDAPPAVEWNAGK